MKSSFKRCAALSLLVAACAQGVAAQTRQPRSRDGEVIRVNVELVQTDVKVVGKL
jgi:hypothetical protein